MLYYRIPSTPLHSLNARVALRKIVMDSQLDQSRGDATHASESKALPSLGTAAGRQMQMRSGQHRISVRFPLISCLAFLFLQIFLLKRVMNI